MWQNRKRAALVAVASALGILGVASGQIAGASHVRPVGATPIRVPIVPAFGPCAAPNRTHGPPLAFASCNPPVQSSSYLTVGTPDSGGGPANSVASVTLRRTSTDFLLTLNAIDIRCRPAGPANLCSSANSSGGPDFSGEIYIQGALRITDHWNSRVPNPSPTDPYDAAGTMQDTGWGPVVASCAATASTSIGGTCSVSVTGNFLEPGFSPTVAGKRFVMEVGQFQVYDGGPDGLFGGPPGSDTLFGVEGIFVP
jgi:hypothetical protein